MQIEEITIADLQTALHEGRVTTRQLTEQYLQRIADLNKQGPELNAIIETNPEALEIADTLDRERAAQNVRGPLHGIPVLIKDNIATVDQMETTAGSLALLGSRPPRDAFVVHKLRQAGALILGKANLSEWANFRSTGSTSGWSARGGVTRNPYVLDRTACGSSSGSATAIAANLAVVSLGTETDGSILCPASINGVVGIKPTVGLTSRAGVIPIAHSQDTVGPFGRTVADAATLLGIIAGSDPRDSITSQSEAHAGQDYTRFLDANGLQGARIGVCREIYFGYSEKADMFIEAAITRMRELGATIVDPANIPTAQAMSTSKAELHVLRYELKADLNTYLSELTSSPVRTLEEIIAFNQQHASQELRYFGQEHFLAAQETPGLDDQVYLDALEENQRLSRTEGIDAVMSEHKLDALVMPTCSPAWNIDLVNGDHYKGSSTQPAALAGYPAISVPAGDVFGLPVGITFMGSAFSEPTLIKLAYAYEQATRHRRKPEFLPTLRVD